MCHFLFKYMSSSVNCTFFTRNQYQPISCRMSKIQQTFVVPVGCGAWKNPITVFVESLLFRGFPDSSVGKESACNIGDLSSIPGSPWRRDRLPTPVFLVFPCGSAGKESACNAGDLGSIPGFGRSPGEGSSYPLQCSGPENSMDSTVHGVAKSQTRLSSFHLSVQTDLPSGTVIFF